MSENTTKSKFTSQPFETFAADGAAVTWVDDDDFDEDDDFEIGGDQNKAKKQQATATQARNKAQHQQSLNVAKQLKSLEGKIASTETLDKTGS
jgi:hypothetical protein